MAITLVFLLHQRMVLHSWVNAHDDAATTGTNIVAGDFPDGGATTIEIDGHLPTIWDIVLASFDAFTPGTASGGDYGLCKAELCPQTWPRDKTICIPGTWRGGSQTADAGVTDLADGSDVVVRNRLNIPALRQPQDNAPQLGENTSWVNAGVSRVFGSIAAQNYALAFYASYNEGKKYPERGGRKLLIRKVIGHVATTEAWAAAINEVLSDDTPGIDPDRYYRVAGLRLFSEGATAGDYAKCVRVYAQGAENYHAVAIGGGVSGRAPWTFFIEDSIPPFKGNKLFKADILMGGGHTDDAVLDILLEEYDAAAQSAPLEGAGAGSQGFGGFNVEKISEVASNFMNQFGIGGGVKPPGGG